jgi:hypothetical protein
MSDQRNEIDTWQQGVFCDEPRYSHIPKSSKDEFIRSEKLRVRPHPKGNAICLCNQPEDAAWIAERLNLAVELERKIAVVTAERYLYRAALERIAGCDWVISLPDRMDAVRKIAQDALRMEDGQ